jgi:hypothetical protein
MNFYEEKKYTGEVWVRNTNDLVYPLPTALSAIFLKYKLINADFYNELQLNKINAFEIFYDTLFIQTQTGYILEKYTYDGSGFLPSNQINNFNAFKKGLAMDYWFDEVDKKIYTFEVLSSYSIENSGFINVLNIPFEFKSFNLKNGESDIILSLNQQLSFTTIDVPSLDENGSFISTFFTNNFLSDPKLTYNIDTNVFNASFVIKDFFSNFGLLSMNFNKKEVLEFNGMLPFGVNYIS